MKTVPIHELVEQFRVNRQVPQVGGIGRIQGSRLFGGPHAIRIHARARDAGAAHQRGHEPDRANVRIAHAY
jgi:hypothetical protein